MKLYQRFLVALAIALPMLPVGTDAHFILVEPASWIEENQLGDPQKVGPCGGEPTGENGELLTGAITEVTGGSDLHLKIQETIYHSGHYRVALFEFQERATSGPVCVREIHGQRPVFSLGNDSKPAANSCHR